jgi:amino acid adenylation domain-containing protein
MRYLLSHLLASAARDHPDRIAVVDRDRTITYAELEERANRLAHLLIDLGVARGDRVGLYADKSLESVIAVHAVLKAGGAYVPFDPNAPMTRLGYIAGNCGIRVLLTGREKERRWAELVSAGAPLDSLVILNGPAPAAGTTLPAAVLGVDSLEVRPASPPAVEMVDDDLAYLLYTSGSTGLPKGVMLSHRNAMTFVLWAADLLDLQPDDRLSNHAPLHFDLSVFDLFAAARAGAPVSLVPAEAAMLPVEMAGFIERERITIWYSVPSALSLLATRGGLEGGEFPDLRAVIFAGEVFPTKYLRRLMTLVPHAAFYNWYGPTETNVCTCYRVLPIPEDQTEPIPIGRAVANTEVFAVTEAGRLPEDEEGELYVRGGGVMRGYWGDPERTEQVLVPNPLGGEPEELVYRTGDLVRKDEHGDFRFLGRRDAQIKSRGYRIELGEIETALYAHPAVVECAVTAVPDDLLTNRIKAFVVVREAIGEPELARFCAERIPRYMIPETFEFRQNLPKTSTGKVDRQALSRV